MSEQLLVEVIAGVVLLTVGLIGWFAVRILRGVERRLDKIEDGVGKLTEQAHQHEVATTALVGKVDGLSGDHERLEKALLKLDDKLDKHLQGGE